MSNELTGDFDVVVEFTIGAANRVLAAMHRGERFPHSLTLRVDDSPPRSELPFQRVAVSIVDKYGLAAVVTHPTTSPPILGRVAGPRAPLLPRNIPFADLEYVVNDRPIGVHLAQEFSHLRGRTQLQLSAPTIELPGQSGTRARILISMMAQYFPDPDTRALPQFLRGEIQITVGVDKVVSQIGSVVDVSLKPGNVNVVFVPTWPPPPGLGPTDINQINKAIRNALLTSFEPYNTVLPPSAKVMHFKGLTGGTAIALLLNMNEDAGDPDSVDNVFVHDPDDFAFGVSADYIVGVFSPLVDQVKTIKIDFTSTVADYSGSVDDANIQLQNGQILLTVEGHAHSGSVAAWAVDASDFSFTITQVLGLDLVDENGTYDSPACSAQLKVIGDVGLTIHKGGIAGAILNAFKDQVLPGLRTARDNAIAGLQPTVRTNLNVKNNLGSFLSKLMNPAGKPGTPPREQVDPILEYSSVDITTAGVVLHGWLSVPPWPPAHAEFQISPQGDNALRSWIPGGTIQQYTWAPPWQPALATDPNTFVFVDPRPGQVSGTHICVTVEGTRISASGPIVPQPVSAKTCRWLSVPLTGPVERIGKEPRHVPLTALARPRASGGIEVMGHTSPWVPAGTQGSANLVIHFPDERSLADLDSLSRALLQCERADATAAIVCVLTPDQFGKVRPMQGLIFAEEHEGAWERLTGVTRRPSTLLISSAGTTVWWHEGELSPADFVPLLRTYLLPTRAATPQLLEASVRVGQPPPNFIFEHAPGREMILRKLAGRPVVLFFWRSFLRPCLETLRQLERTINRTSRRGPIILAINDGEDPELAKKVAAEYGPSTVVVPDPERQISLAYGVNLWPTTVFVDALGLVTDIRYGSFSLDEDKRAGDQRAAAAQ